MKIAIVRGLSLNKWEMANYEPLTVAHQVLTIGSKNNSKKTKEIKLPKVELFCAGEILEKIPKGIEFLYRFFGSPTYLFGLEKAIAGFDIVHAAETFHGYSLQAVRAKKRVLVKKVVLTVWETLPFLHENYPKQLAIKKEVLAGADLFICPIKKAKETLVLEGADPRKIAVIPMGINTSLFRPGGKDGKLQKKLSIKSWQRVILSVGRMVPEKGFETVIKAAFRLKQEKLAFKLVLVGEGPDKKRFERLVRDLQLEKEVVFLGAVPYKEMPKIYQLADIFVLASYATPYWEEQFGMVLLEAMAAGVPLVVSDSQVTREVVGDCGLYFRQKNVQELKDAIKKLLLDTNLSEKIAKQVSKRAVSQFDCLLISRKIEKAYESLFK